MDSTLHALAGILLRAVPTFLLLIFLHFYLKSVFFKPLAQVLQKRYDATEGARLNAQQSLERAAARTAEYEATLHAARGAVYQEQEKLHQQLQEQQAAELHAARQDADALVLQAKAALARDVEATKATLAQDTDRLANQIAESILQRRAA